MKLKTLKDLVERNTMGGCLITERELRNEAIKWIKEIHLNQYSKQSILYDRKEFADININESIEWIKIFFNINESDLK